MRGAFEMHLRSYPARARKQVLETMFEAFTRVNQLYLRTHPNTPDLMDAGVCYVSEGHPEIWRDIPSIIHAGHDDCEGLASWMAAELRERRNRLRARVVLEPQRRRGMWHAIVRDKDDPSMRWDPSKALGMRGRDGTKVPCVIRVGRGKGRRV